MDRCCRLRPRPNNSVALRRRNGNDSRHPTSYSHRAASKWIAGCGVGMELHAGCFQLTPTFREFEYNNIARGFVASWKEEQRARGFRIEKERRGRQVRLRGMGISAKSFLLNVAALINHRSETLQEYFSARFSRGPSAIRGYPAAHEFATRRWMRKLETQSAGIISRGTNKAG